MSIDVMHVVGALRPADATRAAEVFPPEERMLLLEDIIRTPRVAASRRARPAVRVRTLAAFSAIAGLAALAAAIAVTSVLRPAAADGALRFRLAANGSIIATVIDPYAAQSRLNAAFAAHGLHITVTLVPASPSLVGTVVYTSDDGGPDQIQSLSGGHCLTGGGGCPIGVKVPASFHGQGYITLGRAARPGESYESTASAFAPGEALHCSGLLGARVSEALPALAARHLSVVDWRVAGTAVPSAPVSNYVWAVDPVAAAKVRVWTNRTPWPGTPGAGAADNRGCPRRR